MKIPLRQYWRLLIDYLRPQRGRVVLLAALLLTGIALQLINPQILRFFIDTATGAQAGAAQSTQPANAMASPGEPMASPLLAAALVFIAVAVAQQLVTVFSTYVSENVAWTATNWLRSDLARHCLNLDMSFHSSRTPGELIERIDGDVASLANFFSQFVIQVLGNGLLLAGVLVLLFREDWRVGGALMVFAVIALIVLYRLSNIAVPHWDAAREATAEMYGFLEERLAGTEDIRSSGAKPYVMRMFYERMRSRWRKEMKAWFMMNIMVNSTFILFTTGNAVAFGVGAYLFLSGQITIGTVFLIFQYSNILFMPIERITQQIGDLQRAGAGITRIQGLRAIQSKITFAGDGQANSAQPQPATLPSANGNGVAAGEGADRAIGLPLPSGPLSVEFENVSFVYEGDDLVLKDIAFQLQPGKVLGLLGRTGSGKTTLARLLFRLYDPKNGAIYLGDDKLQVDLRDVRRDDLRRRVGMVTQDVQLFHASVRDNLTFFDPDIDDQRILRAIENLGLWSWYASLAKGLDTELQTGGTGLSAGEAQLLAFIRIFLTDPGLVILDEASSRLDPATEQLIERAVDKLLHGDGRGRTAIIIAHRLATVHRADEVMVLEQGRIIEQGARMQLAADPTSRFHRLLQTGLEEMLA